MQESKPVWMASGRIYQGGGATDLLALSADLKAGAIIAYPSESVWGLGCDGFSDAAIERILTLKNRADSKGLITLTDDAMRLMPLLPSEQAMAIIQRINSTSADVMITDGRAVTYLVPIDERAASAMGLPALLTGQYDSLAVRVTPHPLLRSICTGLISDANPCGLLVSTSCNPSGLSPAISLAAAQAMYGASINYLAADSLGFSQPSQIIDALTGYVIR